MDKKGLGIVVVIVIAGVVGGGFGFLPAFEHNVAVQESQPVDATIVSTDLDVREDDDGDKEYNPIVVYRYEVDGETYEQDNTYPGRFTRWTGSRSSATAVVDQYRPGDEVTVHHNPSNPGQAYLRNDGMPGSWLIGIGGAAIVFVGGLWLIWKGFKRWRQRQLIRNTPTESVQALSIGPSEIKGTADTGEYEPLKAPFSDDDCVVAKYEVKEYQEDNDDDGGSWQTIDSDLLYVPFYVDDGTGSVLVKPHEDAVYDLGSGDWSETYVDSSSNGPRPVREFVGNNPDVGFPSNASGKKNDRKYRQNIIRDGESVYVFGTVHPKDETETGASNAERLVVRKADEVGALSEPMYMISDDEEAQLIDRRQFALWRLPLGGFFLVAGLFFVLGIFGPELGLRVPVLF